MRITLQRQRRGVYASRDWRFVLENVSGIGWRLCERGQILDYKPPKQRTARETSPIWYRSDAAIAAVAWAKDRLGQEYR